MNEKQLKIGIIGLGKIGSALARLSYESKVTVSWLSTRTFSRAANLSQELGTNPIDHLEVSHFQTVDIIFICVPDKHLEKVGSTIGDLVSSFSSGPRPILAHTSGNAGLMQLPNGMKIAMFHPIASVRDEGRFPSHSPCLIAGEEREQAALTLFSQLVGFRPIIPDKRIFDPKLYHAACVTASNFVLALTDASQLILKEAGFQTEDARSISLSLQQSVIANLFQTSDTAQSLTGPVIRGDVETVKEHLKALTPYPELNDLYRSVCRFLVHRFVRDPSRQSAFFALLK